MDVLGLRETRGAGKQAYAAGGKAGKATTWLMNDQKALCYCAHQALCLKVCKQAALMHHSVPG